MTHICVGSLTTIGSDNGLSPGRHQAIIWTNAGILLIGPLETIFSEILFEIHTFSFKKLHLQMSSGKWRPFCLGLNVLNVSWQKSPKFHWYRSQNEDLERHLILWRLHISHHYYIGADIWAVILTVFGTFGFYEEVTLTIFYKNATICPKREIIDPMLRHRGILMSLI